MLRYVLIPLFAIICCKASENTGTDTVIDGLTGK